MIHPEKDPTYKSLLLQEALKARGLYDGDPDNWWGSHSEAAYRSFLASRTVHHGQASTFADPADVAAFKRCKATGKTDAQCFEVGDNGIGFWGDDTTTDDAYCALHIDHLKERFGDNWKKRAHMRPVLVSVEGKAQECAIADICGHYERVDLNPGACKALGVALGDMVAATWEWA